MKNSKWTKWVAVAAALGLSGCVLNDAAPGAGQDDQGSNWEIEEPGTAVDALCLPQALVETATGVPELPTLFLELCAASPGGTVEVEPTVTLHCEGDMLTREVTSSSTTSTRTTTWIVDGERIIYVENKIPWYYPEGNWIQTWSFDDDGQMVEASWGDDDEVQQRIVQEFVEGRLVERTVQNQEGLAATSWVYEGDKLVEAIHIPAVGEVETIRYSYERGRPLRIERRVGGELVVEQRWSWTPGGRLVERSTRARLAGFADPVMRLDDFASSLPHNAQYGAYGYYGHSPDIFSDSLFQVDEVNDCHRPPLSSLHAYPRGEEGYELGWVDGDDDFILAMAYQGYGGYYRYGHDEWFGHDGAGFYWPTHPAQESRLEATQRYDLRGRMISEEALFIFDGGEASQEMNRERVFDDNQRLISDGVVFVGLDDGEPIHRVITWRRDVEGRVLDRQLVDGDQVISRQHWQYEGPRAVELEVFSHPPTLHDFARQFEEGTELSRRGYFRRQFDSHGRILEVRNSLELPHSDWESGRFYVYDDDGELVEVIYF